MSRARPAFALPMPEAFVSNKIACHHAGAHGIAAQKSNRHTDSTFDSLPDRPVPGVQGGSERHQLIATPGARHMEDSHVPVRELAIMKSGHSSPIQRIGDAL